MSSRPAECLLGLYPITDHLRRAEQLAHDPRRSVRVVAHGSPPFGTVERRRNHTAEAYEHPFDPGWLLANGPQDASSVASRSLVPELLTIDTDVATAFVRDREAKQADARDFIEFARHADVQLAVAPQGHRLDVPRDPRASALLAFFGREGIEELPQLARPLDVTFPSEDLAPGNVVEGFWEAWNEILADWDSGSAGLAPGERHGSKPNMQDGIHVETHLAAARDVFITFDTAIVTMCRRLRDEHNIPVVAMSPRQYLDRPTA